MWCVIVSGAVVWGRHRAVRRSVPATAATLQFSAVGCPCSRQRFTLLAHEAELWDWKCMSLLLHCSWSTVSSQTNIVPGHWGSCSVIADKEALAWLMANSQSHLWCHGHCQKILLLKDVKSWLHRFVLINNNNNVIYSVPRVEEILNQRHG